MNKLLKVLRHPSWIIVFLNKKGLYLLSDKNYINLLYKLYFEKKLNLENPKTFNEKLQWLKLNNRKTKYTKMVDKYEVKKYVADIIGEEYIIPTLGIYEKYDDIDFDKFPNQFVMKCTHDSGGLVICKDKSKLDIKYSKKKINKCLKRNFYYYSREWPYKNVKKRIIIEQYMEEENCNELKDYKFWCFNGEPKICLVCTNRQKRLRETFFDMDWKLLNLKRPHHDIDKELKMPIHFKKMKELAKVLSNNFPFIRVDFYEINSKIYFGELTFYPAGGLAKFEPEEWDKKLGNMLDISKINKKE